jgi:uncharacterized membrane protein
MRFDRASGRRVATVGLLALASALAVALVEARIERTGTPEYRFLVWNLFLAWLPFVLALAVYDGYRRGRSAGTLLCIGALWLLFLPNAPYIFTDFVHLREFRAAPVWYDVLTLSAFSFTGLLLGLGSLFLVQTVVTAARGPILGWATGLGALTLSSVGIYLGRFVRLNSWDVLVDPTRVLAPIAAKLDESLLHPRFMAVTVGFTAFLVLAYLLLYAVAQPGLALDPRRPSRR